MQSVIQAELERLFDPAQIEDLAATYLGLTLERVGEGRPALASELVERCVNRCALEALCDAIVLLRPGAERRIDELRQRRGSEIQPLMHGDTLGTYRIERELGAGPVGRVFAATDETSPVRVKVLRPSLGDRSALQRYWALSRAVSGLGVAGFAHLRETTEIDGCFVLVHNLVRGRVLADARATRQPQALAAIAPLLRALLAALCTLHRRGLVHGDLRASNVLVTETRSVVLLDGGAHFICPPRDLLAPEQMCGELPTAQSDVYAFGWLLYELVSGKPPFTGTRASMVEGRLARLPEPASFVAPRAGIGAELDEWLLDLLDREPARRPPDAEALSDRLESLLALRRPVVARVSDDELQRAIDELAARPDDEELAAALESTIEQGADPARVASAFGSIAWGVSPRSPARRSLLRRAAALFEPCDARGAETAYRALIADEPCDESAWAGLERLARLAGDYEKLVELGLEQVDTQSDRPSRARSLAAIGDVLRTKLGDPVQAREAYLRAWCEDPCPTYAAELEALAGSDQTAWIEVLGSVAEAVMQEQCAEARIALLLQLGRWYDAQVARGDIALQCYEAVLLVEPNQEQALLGAAELWQRQRDGGATAAALYERLIALKPSQRAAHEALARIYQHTDVQAYDRALERWAATCSGREWRELTLRRAELREKERDLAAASALYDAVLARDPRDARALAGQDRVLSLGDHSLELRGVLEREIEAAHSPRHKLVLLERLATLLGSEFLDAAGAASALEELLLIDPRNVAALRELCGSYAKLERWEDLDYACDRLVAALPSDEERAVALVAHGQVLEQRLRRPDLALCRYEAALAIDRRHIPALTAIARLHAASGAIDRAVEALENMAALEALPESRAQHLTRAAELLLADNRLLAAMGQYRRALAILPGAPAIVLGLAGAQVASGDIDGAIELLKQELARAGQVEARAELALELARLSLRKGDDARAKAAAETALESSADVATARGILGDVARHAGDFHAAAAHYAAASERRDRLPPARATQILISYAEVLFESNQRDQANARLDELVRDFPGDTATMLQVTEILFGHAENERTVGLCRRLLESAADSLDDAKRSFLLFRLGESLRRQGKLEEAIAPLERALQLDPSTTAPFVALRAVFTAQARWVDVSRSLARQLERTPRSERAGLLVEIGDLAATTLGDPTTAAQSYVAALRNKPRDHKILLKLVRLYTAERDFQKVFETILELADATPLASDRARHLLVAARVAVSELDDRMRALTLTARALELDPASEQTLREAMLLRREAGDRAGARRVLERRVEAAAAANDAALAVALADEYLADVEGEEAIAVNEAVLRLVGEEPPREQALLDLYESDLPRYLGRALTLAERAVVREPTNPEPYRRLVRLYRAVRDVDGVFCASQALVALDCADESEQGLFEEQRARGDVPEAVLGDQDWQELVVHPSVDATLTRIASLLEPVLRRERAISLERLGQEQVSPIAAAETAPLPNALRRSARLVGIQPPRLFVDSTLAAGLRMPPTSSPSFMISESARAATVPQRQAAFVAGAHVCYAKPGFYARVLVPKLPSLKAWLLAAMRLVMPKLSVAAELEPLISEAQGILQRELGFQVRDALAESMSTLLREERPLDVAAWLAGVDLTSDRLGFIACGDLPTALTVIRATGEGSSAVPVAERERQLLAYSVSPRYLALRAKCAMTVSARSPRIASAAAE